MKSIIHDFEISVWNFEKTVYIFFRNFREKRLDK